MNLKTLVLLAASAGLTACGGHESRPPAAALPAASVTLGRVEEITSTRYQAVAGTVRPADRAVVSARVSGVVVATPFGLGDRVGAGQVLISLSAPELSARLDQARATLAQVERELGRENSLLEQRATTADSVRLFEDRKRAAEAAVEEALALQSYTELKAPFDGVVIRRPVEAGDLAVPGAPLIEIEGTGQLQAWVSVPESLGLAPLGTELAIEDSSSATRGRLAELSPAADPASHTRTAKIDLPAGAPYSSGQFVRVLWPAGTETALVAPAAAVSNFGQMERVFVAAEGRAQLRLVKTGGTAEGRTRILAGLEPGESVVVRSSVPLRDGQPLEVRP